MNQKYIVVFVLAEISDGKMPVYRFGGEEVSEIVFGASSKADAVMKVVDDYDVYQVLSVDRIK